MNKPISLIILASATIHALALGLIDFNSPVKIIAAGTLMRVSIHAPSPDSVKQTTKTSKNIAKPVQKNKIAKLKKKNKVKPITKNVTDSKNIPEQATNHVDIETSFENRNTTKNNTIVAKLENTSNESALLLPESVSSLLHSDLERAFALHFYYPRRAIKRGWQGEVKISLRIEANGHLTRVRILNSSGHKLLDNAAITSIHKVQILPTAIALLDGQILDLVLPVEYRLL